MGIVFQARELRTRRDVAIKWLPAAKRPTGLGARFEREAAAAAAVRHPNIVSILSAGQTPEGDYLVMELANGFPLSTALAGRRLGVASLCSIMAKVARALAAAHQAGIIHRDVKPSNIMVDATGEPRVVDFGAARFLDAHSSLTGAQVVGTFLYMAPEVVLRGGAAASPASDIFSLGCVIQEGLTGSPPFGVDMNALTRITRGAADPLPSTVPFDLAHLCHRMLSLQPSARPDGTEVAAALEALARRLERPATPTPKALQLVVGLAMLVVVLAGIALALFTSRSSIPSSGIPQLNETGMAPPPTISPTTIPAPKVREIDGDASKDALEATYRRCSKAASSGNWAWATTLARQSLAQASDRSNDPLTHVFRGRFAFLAHQEALAAQAYDRALELDPKNRAALFGAVCTEFVLHRPQLVQRFNALRDAAPDSVETRAAQALATGSLEGIHRIGQFDDRVILEKILHPVTH
jgi:serine/threonine protein kinase